MTDTQVKILDGNTFVVSDEPKALANWAFNPGQSA